MPSAFKTREQGEALEILAATLIAGHMIWPEAKEARSRSLYLTLGLRKIHDVLLATNKEQAQATFTALVETYFGGWPEYSQNLASVQFPSQGKGSIVERAWQGSLTGMVFLHAFRNATSLNDAAAAVADELRDAVHADALDGMLKPAPENIMKNYWPRFQHVAHFWAAMRYFVMPEPTDSIIRLDKAVPIPEMAGKIRPGWRGVVDTAHDFLERSADVKRYKTHKPLLDQSTAFRVVFTE
jgi:hypothetical protein